MYLQASVVLALIITVWAEKLPEGKPFRADYKYNSKVEAYYKIHTESETKYQASEVCKAEGGKLMMATKEDLTYIHGLYKSFPNIDDAVWISKEDGEESEENQKPLIVMQEDKLLETLCYTLDRKGNVEVADCHLILSFVCRIEKKDVYYDPICDVNAHDYTYNNVTNKCYKFSKYPLPWFEASQECEAEQSHLLVLNSEAEHQEIMKLMKMKPAYMPKSFHSHYVIIGFRVSEAEKEKRIFKTIFNETLKEAGYDDWSDGEPNNVHNSEYCGSLFRGDYKLNDVNCENRYGFICEK